MHVSVDWQAKLTCFQRNFFSKMNACWKEPFVKMQFKNKDENKWEDVVLQPPNRTGCDLDVWERRQCPLQSRSYVSHVLCTWRHHEWRFQGIVSTRHEFLRRWGRRFAWHHHGKQDDEWPVSWCPGCCHVVPFNGVLLPLCPSLCFLCRGQWFFGFESIKRRWVRKLNSRLIVKAGKM